MVYKDYFGEELKQGDIVVFPDGKDVIRVGVVKSLFWSKTYGKYTGIYVSYYYTAYKTATIKNKSLSGRECVIHTPNTISQELQDLVDKCKSERWETQPNLRPVGTNILSSLTHHYSSATMWYRNESYRLERIKNPYHNPKGGAYNLYNHQPKQSPSPLKIIISAGESKIEFIFEKQNAETIVYRIYISGNPGVQISLPELCVMYNVSPPDVVKRIDRIISAMKGGN